MRTVWHTFFRLAGVEGIGPSTMVLETIVLPLNYTPVYQLVQYNKHTPNSQTNCFNWKKLTHNEI